MACGKKCSKSGKDQLTDEQRAILQALANMEEPGACKDIAEATGLKSNSVSCRLRSLKSRGYVESPVRCKYAITETGRQAVVQA